MFTRRQLQRSVKKHALVYIKPLQRRIKSQTRRLKLLDHRVSILNARRWSMKNYLQKIQKRSVHQAQQLKRAGKYCELGPQDFISLKRLIQRKDLIWKSGRVRRDRRMRYFTPEECQKLNRFFKVDWRIYSRMRRNTCRDKIQLSLSPNKYQRLHNLLKSKGEIVRTRKGTVIPRLTRVQYNTLKAKL
jgi:DNA-binding response OmpR family regulator